MPAALIKLAQCECTASPDVHESLLEALDAWMFYNALRAVFNIVRF